MFVQQRISVGNVRKTFILVGLNQNVYVVNNVGCGIIFLVLASLSNFMTIIQSQITLIYGIVSLANKRHQIILVKYIGETALRLSKKLRLLLIVHIKK